MYTAEAILQIAVYYCSIFLLCNCSQMPVKNTGNLVPCCVVGETIIPKWKYSNGNDQLYICQYKYLNMSRIYRCNNLAMQNYTQGSFVCEIDRYILNCLDVTDSPEGMQMTFANLVYNKIRPLTILTGIISIFSAGTLFLGLLVFILTWRLQSVHRWTQFSLILALFFTFFVAGVRRLVSTETRNITYSQLPELLEDFGAASVSTNLIIMSFDLFYMIWKVLPPNHEWHSYKRFWISMALAWLPGILIVVLHLNVSINRRTETSSENTLPVIGVETLEGIFEILLCIQMYSSDLTLTIWLTYSTIALFSATIVLFLAIAFILFRRRKYSKLVSENFSRDEIVKTWISRFIKMFLLIGLWWPLNLVCIFQCFATRDEILSAWRTLDGSQKNTTPKLDYDVPWHIYIIQNCLALQSIIICVILLVNNKTINDIKVTLKYR